MHYYKHNIADYKKDTHYLSLLEHGVYRQLLDMYYLSESPIPKETQLVFRRLSAKTQEEQNAVLFVLSEFFIEDENGYLNKRCDAELLEYKERGDTNRANGKLGGRPKKTQSVISGNPDNNQNESENNLNSLTNKLKNSSIHAQIWFDEFYAIYPKKVAKQDAIKAWAKINPNEELKNKIIASLKTSMRMPDWTKDNGQFIPYPATWLNGKRWEDAPLSTSIPTVKPEGWVDPRWKGAK